MFEAPYSHIEPVLSNMRTIIFASSNPAGTEYLDVNEELREVKGGIERGRYGNLINLNPCPAVQIDDLITQMEKCEPDIIHFCGHGETSQLIFQDHNGNPEPADKVGLIRLFNTFKDSLKLVFLNACYSAEQAQEIANYVDCVIGINSAIENKVGRIFAVSFYSSIANGHSFKVAFERALARVLMIPGVPGKQFEIYLRPGTNPDSIRLFEPQDGDESVSDSESRNRVTSASREHPIVILPNIKVLIYDKTKTVIELPWNFPTGDCESMKQDFWDDTEWEKINDDLQILYSKVRDIHISLSLFRLNIRYEEHKIHAQKVLSSSFSFFDGLLENLASLPAGCSDTVSITTLSKLRDCANLLRLAMGREDQLENGIELSERMCHWLLEAQALTNTILKH